MEPSYLQDPRGDPLGVGGDHGKYRLIRRLAVGGMAEIFLARAVGIERFEKPVVLKRLLPQFENNREFVAMFLQEARLAGRLSHPNIAQVYDIGRKAGSYFFTMEYVHGQTLRAILRATSERNTYVPLEAAIFIAAGVASALHYAHDRRGSDGRPLRIVHRDISPSNVIITYGGCVKVVDFGIAKAADQDHQTRSGTLKGKIPYMSPEQCRGEPVDRRSDIFSLGTVLYELTTGTPLFGRGNELTVLRQVAEGRVTRPSERRAGYPPQLERIVLKALAPDVTERYQTAEALVADLERLAADKKLVMSARAVARLMEELFGTPAEPDLDGASSSAGPLIGGRPLPLPAAPVTRSISFTAPDVSVATASEPEAPAWPAESLAASASLPAIDVEPVIEGGRTRSGWRGLGWAALGFASLGTLVAVLALGDNMSEPADMPLPVEAERAPAEAAAAAPAATQEPAATKAAAETPAAPEEPAATQAATEEPASTPAAPDKPADTQAVAEADEPQAVEKTAGDPTTVTAEKEPANETEPDPPAEPRRKARRRDPDRRDRVQRSQRRRRPARPRDTAPRPRDEDRPAPGTHDESDSSIDSLGFPE